MSTPLTDEQLAAIKARADRVSVMPDHPGSYFTFKDSAEDVPALTAEVERLKAHWAEWEWAEMLTHQSCGHGKHADWWVDSEHNHLCPWCEIERLKAERERIREYSEHIRKSGNGAYAKAGRTLLEMFDGEATP
jgi:uncharacterized small protein (DUF1192 family)